MTTKPDWYLVMATFANDHPHYACPSDGRGHGEWMWQEDDGDSTVAVYYRDQNLETNQPGVVMEVICYDHEP